MRKRLFILDERERIVFRDLIAVLYFITLAVLIAMQLYRQFVLNQPSVQWNDMALLITFNILFLLGGGLYLSGTVNLKKIKARYIVIGYAAFVLLGLLFTIFKYAVFLKQDVRLEQVWDYFLIILPITAVLVIAWGLLGYLGHRRMEQRIE
jgi:heme/copper-type cytochrome/quinol oxidase subunit 3